MNDLHFIQEYKPISVTFNEYKDKDENKEVNKKGDIQITYEKPLFCSISKILQINKEKGFTTVLLVDANGKEIFAFVYKDIANILAELPKSFFPITVVIIKGIFKILPSRQRYLEIYHAILDNFTYINSSWIGGYEYCEIQSFLDLYFNVASEANEYMMWGNLIHDYLAILFPKLKSSNGFRVPTKQDILSAFQIAVSQNWQYFVILGKLEKNIINEFYENFLENELEFIRTHLQDYQKKFSRFDIFCEKFVQSPVIGLQGRIDRFILDLKQERCTIIETKTGRSKRASQMIAYYQGLTYGAILQDLYQWNIEEILIEYPRHPPNERFSHYSLNPPNKNKEIASNKAIALQSPDFLRILKIRNKLWSFLVGLTPLKKPDTPCAQCSAKKICKIYLNLYKDKFYQLNLKSGASTNEQTINDIIFQTSSISESTFKKDLKLIRFYADWFQFLIDHEFLAVKRDMLKSFNEIQIQEEKGVAIGGLTLIIDDCSQSRSKNLINQSFQYQFSKPAANSNQKTRFRSGDYILITPQTLNKYKVGSISGIITEINSEIIIVQTSQTLEKFGKDFAKQKYRIDFSFSNYHIWQYKQALDVFIRASFNPEQSHEQLLKDLLLFKEYPKLIKKIPSISEFEKEKEDKNETKNNLNQSQIQAINSALQAQRLALIQGPPGTGKTTVITEIIHYFLKMYQNNHLQNKNPPKNRVNALDRFFKTRKRYIPPKIPVLICAFTNKAVDLLVEKLIQRYPKIKCIRIGNVHSSNSKIVKSHNLEILCTYKKKLYDQNEILAVDPLKARLLLENVDVVATTTTMVGSLLLEPYFFAMVILDEAGQILEPGAIIPLLKGEKGVLVGDHQQLPPITQYEVINDDKNLENLVNNPLFAKLNFDYQSGLNKTLFERLLPRFQNTSNFTLLQSQYRMHKTISQFISHTFYEDKLIPGTINSKNIGDFTWFDFLSQFIPKSTQIQNIFLTLSNLGKFVWNSSNSMIFLDTKQLKGYDSSYNHLGAGNESKYNTTEITTIKVIIKELLTALHGSNIKLIAINEILENIGIISAFRAHNAKISEFVNTIQKNLRNKQIKEIQMSNKNISFSDITVDTVDRFQGNEREVIIYSFVDSRPDHELSSLNSDFRRLNVAISRARTKIIFIGDSATLCSKSTNNSPQTKKIKSIHNQLLLHIKNSNGYWKLSPFDLEIKN
ncbi:MAG: AAA domain-containing protein [Candidatus Lokiarchaeota archaeon]|nr:AAA domain-containing protein [Candidatus Harpocratesius repetitus]